MVLANEVAGMKKGYLDIEKLTNEGWLLFRNIHTQNSIASEMRKLEYFAAPDVVEVVRCKDCNAYRKDKELARAKYFDEEQFCALLMCEMPENGFCWYGKRKEDEK